MLVLSRKKTETIVIPAFNIVITITEVRGDKVRVGFDAPREIEILRGELIDFGSDDNGSPAEAPAHAGTASLSPAGDMTA